MLEIISTCNSSIGLIALGVGVKAVPGLVAVQTPDGSQDASDMSFSELINSPFAPSKDDGPPSQMLNTGTRTSSALHSIMEQGTCIVTFKFEFL